MADIYKKINKNVSYTTWYVWANFSILLFKNENYNPVINKISNGLCLTSNLNLLLKFQKNIKIIY